jgi:hypothetical protein
MKIYDDENELEQKLIDPFATPTVSQEAYAFPVEQFSPTPVVVDSVVDLEPAPVVVPGDGKLGIQPNELEPNQSLALVPEVQESNVNEVTDTPQDPVSEPGIHVSFELSLPEETEQERNDSDNFDQLVEVYERLKELGGVCKEDVIQVESIAPGILTSHRPMNMYSTISTPIGLEVSLESIGSELSKSIKRLIAGLIEHVKTFFGWLVKHLIDGRKTDDLNKIKDRWAQVEKLAASKDSTRGSAAFRKLYGDTDIGRKSSTTPHFAQLYAQNELKELSETKTNLGIRFVSSGKLYGEVTEHLRSIDGLRKAISDAMVSLHAKGETTLGKTVKADTYTEMLARTKSRYNEKSTLVTTNINNALTIKDAVANNRDAVKTISDYVKTFENNLKDLDKKANDSKTNFQGMKDGIRIVREAFTALVASISVLDLYFKYYQDYFDFLTTVINRTERKIAAII